MTLLSRRVTHAGRLFAGVVMAGALLLSACQSNNVQNVEVGTQPDRSAATIFPPGVLPGGGAFYPGAPLTGRESSTGAPNVGLLLPLSGVHAEIGKTLLNASQLAVFQIAGDEFTLIVRDTGGTAEGARQAARSALDAGASLILGPLFSESVPAAAEVAVLRGVNVVAFSNDMKVAGDGVYVMGLAPGPEVERVVGFASAQGLGRFALFAPNNGYGHAVIGATQSAVAAIGRDLARIGAYDPALSDPSPQVRSLADYEDRHQELLDAREALEGRTDEASIKELERLETLDTISGPPFDAIILPVGGRTLLTLAPLLAFYDVDPGEVQFLGTSLWDDPGLGSEVTLRGGWFAAPTPALWREFSLRYREVYGENPARIASIAYDATALAAVLSRSAAAQGRLPDYGTRAITQASGFAGIDGIFRFRPSGEIQRGLAVLEVGKNGIAVLDPAPVTFEELIN